MRPPVKLLVAIASEQVRAAVVRELQGQADIESVMEVGDSTSALREAEERRPDVILMGVDLEPADGFETVRSIVARVPGVSSVLVAVNPSPADFRKALQVGARDLLEVPVDKKELLAALRQAAEVSKAKRSTLQEVAAQLASRQDVKIAKRIVVFSTKGGTGKTFLATNLAAGLARTGARVALVDLDLQFGDAAIALGLVPERTIYDLVQAYTEYDLTLLEEFMVKHPAGLSVLPAPLYPDEAERITTADIQAVLEVIQGGFDYVIVDTPPFFEERVLVALDWADHVLLVAGLDIPSVKHLKTVFRTMGLMAYPEEKLFIVMNRADSKVGLEVSEVEKHLGRPVKASLSSSIEVPRALNAGELLLLSKPGSKVARELAELVKLFVEPDHAGQARPAEAAGGRGMFRGRKSDKSDGSGSDGS
jgi:pilus assembly protein CpaE